MGHGEGIRVYQLVEFFSSHVNEREYCTYCEHNSDAPGSYQNCRITSVDEDHNGVNIHYIRPDGTEGPVHNVNPRMYVHTWWANEDCNAHFKKADESAPKYLILIVHIVSHRTEKRDA